MQQDPSGQPFVVARERRDATVVIRGYVYQVNTTLLRWIELQPDQWLELEAGEDIDILQQAVTSENQMDRLFEAIKCRERNLTLRSPEALAALASFQEHRKGNPALRLFFRYITNSSIGTENPPVTRVGTPGIHLWERIRCGSMMGREKVPAISAMRTFLRKSARPSELAQDTWDLFVGYLKQCSIPEFNRFIDAFEWSTDQPSANDIDGRVRYSLVARGKVKSVDEAGPAFEHLFHFVFALLSKRSRKILTAETLEEELKRIDQSETGRNILCSLRLLETAILSRFDRLERQIAPLQPGISEISATVNRIERTLVSRPESRLEDSVGAPLRAEVRGGHVPNPPSLAATGAVYEIGKPAASIVFSALLAQNEELAATVVAQAKSQIGAIREAAQKGRRSEALQALTAQKTNRAAWQVLPSEKRAELLRLEASILLSSEGGVATARRILDEAEALVPTENGLRLQACIACWERDLDKAMALLRGKQQPESLNLLAVLLMLAGRDDESWQTLPSLDSDPAVRAETLRIRALNLLHKRDIGGARTEVDQALVAEPEWPSLQLMSAMISYYEALSPAVIPSHVQEWPEVSSPVFALNTREAKAKLREAADIFAHWAQWPENSVEERRLLEVWCLACLVADRARREEASTYAKKVLAADAAQYRIIPWVLAQRYEGLDLSAAENAFAEVVASGRAKVFQVVALVMLQLVSSRAVDALSVLDATKGLFIAHNSKNGWHHWRALALLTAGELAQAESELNQFDQVEKLDPLWGEIQRIASQLSGDWDSYAALLKLRYLSTKTVSALFEYCDFQAHRQQWTSVSELAADLLEYIGTPEALFLAAVAIFNIRKPRECLNILDSRRDFLTDETRGEELERLSIACHRKLGQLMPARQQAEHLCDRAGSTENLLLLAQLQLDTGDSKALALNARQLSQRQDLSSEQALRVAVLVRQEDFQLARSLWRRSIANNPPDDAVGSAISLGYHLGLDRELGSLLVRMNDLGDRGVSGIQRKSLDDVIEHMKNHRKNVDWLGTLYNQGEMTIHLIPTNIRGHLADLYHGGLSSCESEPEKAAPALFAVHGGRSTMEGFPSAIPGWRLNVDVTSLLLAQHLDILPKLEKVFRPLRVPPSIFLALGAMQDSISAAQLSQIEAAREVLASVASGTVGILEPSIPDSKDNDLVATGGAGWAKLYELSRSAGGRVIDFLPKVTMSPTATMPPDADARLANCRTIVESLQQHGALSTDDYLSSLKELGTEGQRPSVGAPISRDTEIFCDSGIAKLLAGAKLLRPICRTFRLQMLREDVNGLKEVLSNYERAQELAGWISALSGHVRQGITHETYEFMPIAVQQDDANDLKNSSFDVKCLFELLTFTPEPSDVIWVDDRYLNAYQRRDCVPIVSILEILKVLVAARKLTPTEYYRLLTRLRAAKCAYIPLESGEILYHLSQAPVTANALTETPELAILRRYWAESLGRGKTLLRPTSANGSGEIAFLLNSARAVRDALTGLWRKNISESDEQRETRAEWLLQALYIDYLGIHAVAELPPSETQDHELIGVSVGSLIVAGLDMLVSSNCTPQSLHDYLHWLSHRVLRNAFERDVHVLERTGAFIQTTLREHWQTVTPEEKIRAARLYQFILEILPIELREIIQADRELARALSIGTISLVGVGDIRFSKEEYLKAAREAVNGRCSSAKVWASAEEITFEPAGDGILLKKPTGETLSVT